MTAPNYRPMHQRIVEEKDLPQDAVIINAESFDQVSRDYNTPGYHDGDNTVIRGANQLIVNLLSEIIPKGTTFYELADFASGPGARIDAIRQAVLKQRSKLELQILGLDISPKMLEEAEPRLDYVLEANLCYGFPTQSQLKSVFYSEVDYNPDVITVLGASFGYALFPGKELDEAEEMRAGIIKSFYDSLKDEGHILLELFGDERGSIFEYEKNPVDEDGDSTWQNQFYLKCFNIDEVRRMTDLAGIDPGDVNIYIGSRTENNLDSVVQLNLSEKKNPEIDWNNAPKGYYMIVEIKKVNF